MEMVEYFEPHSDRRWVISLPQELEDTITPHVEYIFSNGQCHALAVALSEILGWPIVGCYHRFGNDRATHHYAVARPGGGAADIHGIRFLDHGTRKAKASTILNGKNRAFLKPAMEFARHYAPMIAAEILKQDEALSRFRPKPKWTLCSEGYAD